MESNAVGHFVSLELFEIVQGVPGRFALFGGVITVVRGFSDVHCFIEANFESSLEGNSGKRHLAAHDTANIVVVVFLGLLYYSSD